MVSGCISDNAETYAEGAEICEIAKKNFQNYCGYQGGLEHAPGLLRLSSHLINSERACWLTSQSLDPDVNVIEALLAQLAQTS